MKPSRCCSPGCPSLPAGTVCSWVLGTVLLMSCDELIEDLGPRRQHVADSNPGVADWMENSPPASAVWLTSCLRNQDVLCKIPDLWLLGEKSEGSVTVTLGSYMATVSRRLSHDAPCRQAEHSLSESPRPLCACSLRL